MVTELQQRGYLDNIASQPCIDDRGGPDPDAVIASEIDRRAGGLQLTWPPTPWSASWDDDEFWELVEIVHDLVARPRHATYHDFGSCGWHYSHHSRGAGQAVYRWRVNELLTRHGVDLQLADRGEDRGRLVHVPSDERSELLQRAVSPSIAVATRESVEHAIALFRSRNAGREDKRSACIALAAVLEERREQLKTDLLSKDEGALFQIANQFAIRHRRADQQSDYDQAYLDWLFWWYLATVELTNRLLARELANRAVSQ